MQKCAVPFAGLENLFNYSNKTSIQYFCITLNQIIGLFEYLIFKTSNDQTVLNSKLNSSLLIFRKLGYKICQISNFKFKLSEHTKSVTNTK